jgi:cardiolipin synthase
VAAPRRGLSYGKGNNSKMKANIKNRLRKKDIFTIPNMLSFFRILLIPLIVILYVNEYRYAAVGVIVLSALTDIVDGWIARTFHMISDFGKFLDPVADKLTQMVMLSCLVLRYPWAISLVALLIIKELFQFVCGFIAFKRTDVMNSAKWFGKVNTVILYTSMIILFLLPEIPEIIATVILTVCGVTMLLSMFLYGRFFRQMIIEANEQGDKKDEV